MTMKYAYSLSLLVIFCSCQSQGPEIEMDANPWIELDTEPESDYSLSANLGKSIAIMGGSISCKPESEVCKLYWCEQLGLQLTDHGINGAGFSTIEDNPGIQQEVDWCIRAKDEHDIYLLWASSNDFTKGDGIIGELSDYSEADGYDSAKLHTMMGGLNYCYHHIQQYSPEAQILLFTSLPIFNKGKAGYESRYNDGIGMCHYVEAEIRWAQSHHIPYLDLFGWCQFTVNDYQPYYKPDQIHLNEKGYKLLQRVTTEFLAYPDRPITR